jgi:hypothetical protein
MMIYGLEGYEPRGLQAPRRPMGQSTATVGGNRTGLYLFIGVGLVLAGYVMTREERKGSRR